MNWVLFRACDGDCYVMKLSSDMCGTLKSTCGLFQSPFHIFYLSVCLLKYFFFFYLSCRWWEHYFGGDSEFFYCGDYCFFWGLLFVCVCESVTDTVTSKSCASFYFLLSVQACEGTEYISKLFKIGLDKLVQLDVEAQWGGSTCILLFILMLICAEL